MPPIASFTVNTSFYTVSVNASTSVSDVEITSYDWDWGDGLTGTGVTTSHTYAQSGGYIITLTVTDANSLQNSTTWQVYVGVIENQYRYALETLKSPYPMALNPSFVHDHDSVYIYRILPMPVTVELTFLTNGVSYVEVFDADNQRFLLPERTEITQDTAFIIEWDGSGVFEVRVWKDSFVSGIDVAFTLPDEQVISEIGSVFNLAPVILGTGIVFASAALSIRQWGGTK